MKQKIRRLSALASALLLTLSLAACTGKKNEEPDEGSQDVAGWVNPIRDPRPGSDYQPQVPSVGEALEQAHAQNSDVVAWLQVPGTELSEAVVQTTDNKFYYRRDVTKNYSFSGSLWMDYESTVGDGSTSALSQNVIIYGHNLGNPQGVKDDPNGVKFAQLFKFDDLEFAKNHPYIYLTTGEETHIYEIFTVFYSEDVLSPVPYHYASFTPQKYEKLIADVRERSQFDYNVNVGPQDKIISLSTCSYKYGTYSQNPHQRFVVMGKLVTEGEDFYETADVHQNPDPKEPDFSK